MIKELLDMNEQIEKQKRRMKFLEEDEECFGLTSSEEIELKKLKEKFKR